MINGASWSFPARGATLSLVAGTVGAAGAFCVLLAFGARGTPAVVMSIVFAGAPVVNAVVAMLQHPPAGGFSTIRWQFVAGILMAALGGCLVTLYKPPPGTPTARVVQTEQARPSGG
jgi:drug/metabolite transporter (DMT)-like permease